MEQAFWACFFYIVLVGMEELGMFEAVGRVVGAVGEQCRAVPVEVWVVFGLFCLSSLIFRKQMW